VFHEPRHQGKSSQKQDPAVDCFYSAAERRSRGALWPSFALARSRGENIVPTTTMMPPETPETVREANGASESNSQKPFFSSQLEHISLLICLSTLKRLL